MEAESRLLPRNASPHFLHHSLSFLPGLGARLFLLVGWRKAVHPRVVQARNESSSREGQVEYVDTLRAPLDQLPVRYAVHVRSDDTPTDHQLSIFVEEVLL